MSSSSLFRSFRRLERFNIILTLPLAALLVPYPIMAQTAPVVVAPGSGTTKTYMTPGGVAVVDINTANAAGLSHNTYTHFNVPELGLVLNNAAPTQFTVPSQLAGSVTTNFNLKTPASVILNEVVAANASTIAGFTEVVGGKADVVIANPWGIAVKGGGFINTDRVTLATGVPVFGADGGLTALRIGSGELSVSGNGLNGSNLSVLDLLARTVKIDGQVNAQDLTVGAGASDFDYATRSVTANPSAASGATPTHAIDSSAVGGMYANRIRLVATEAGVGVRMLGDAAALAEDVSIDAAGRLEVNGKVSAERDVRVSGAGVTIAGDAASVAAKGNVWIDATTDELVLDNGLVVADGALTLWGRSLRDTSANADKPNRYGGESLTLRVTEGASAAGAFYGAGGALDWQSGSTTLGDRATLYSGLNADAANRSLTMRATSGNLETGDAQLLAEGSLTLTADQGAIRIGRDNDNGVQARGNVTLAARTALDNAGNVTAGGDVSVRALNSPTVATVANSGKLVAGDALTLGASGQPALSLDNAASGVIGGRTVQVRADAVTNAGVIQAQQALTLDVSSAFTNRSDAAVLTAGQAGSDVAVKAGTLTNAGFVQSTGALDVNVLGATSNSGVLATQTAAQSGADRAVTLKTSTLDNAGVIQSANTLNLGTTASSGTTLTNRGTLQAVGAIAIDAGPRFENAVSGSVLSGNSLTIQSTKGGFELANAGRLQATQNLAIGTSAAPVKFTQASGAVTFAGGIADLKASALDNAGVVQSTNALTLNVATTAHNRATGEFATTNTAGSNLQLTAATLTNAGRFQSTGSIDATLSGAVDNSGTLLTVGSRGLTLASETLTNSGIVESRGALDVTTRATSATALTNSGKLIAGAATSLTSAGHLDNQKTGLVNSAAALTLNSATLANAGVLQAGGAVSATANSVVNSGSVMATGALDVKSKSTLTNSGLLQGGGNVTLVTPQTLTNTRSGTILGGANLSLMSGAGSWSFANSGHIQSAGTLSIGASGARASFDNAATGTIHSGRALTVAASSFLNTGQVQSGGTAVIEATKAGTTSFANSGRIQASDTLTVIAPTRQEVTGLVLGGRDVTLRSNAGDFVLYNTGTVQAATDLSIAESAGRVDLQNAGKALAGTGLNVVASTVTNSGQLQAGHTADIEATGAIDNSGVVYAGGSGRIDAASLDNSGNVEAGSRLEITTSGSTTNSGAIAATQGDLDLRANHVLNVSANSTITAGSNLALTTTGGDAVTLTNHGSIASGGNTTLTTANGLLNSHTGTIKGDNNVTVVSGGNGFTFTNLGQVGSGAHLSIGTNSDRVTLDNQLGGVLSAGGTLVATASTITNAGTIQGANAVTLDVTGALTNTIAGTILANGGAHANVNAVAATITNAGQIQSSGTMDLLAAGAITNANNGTLLTSGAGALNATAATITNSSAIQSGGAARLMTATDLTNHAGARIQSGTDMTVTTPHQLSNSGAMLSGRDMTIVGGSTAFDLINDGRMQAAQNFTFGGASARATVTNAPVNAPDLNGVITQGVISAGGAMQGHATTITNSGYIEAGSLTLDASGALTNQSDARVLTSTGAFTANVASIDNAVNALVQSAGAMTLTTVTTINNLGNVQAHGAIALTTPSALLNASTARIVSETSSITLGGDQTPFTITNFGRMQAAQDFTFGSTSARAAFTNAAASVPDSNGVIAQGAIQAGGALTGHATSLMNLGLVQSNGATQLNASGAITNAAGSKLLVGDANHVSSLGITAASLTNQGDVQAQGALTATLSGAFDNSGMIATFSATDGMLTVTAGSTLTNQGTIGSAAALTLGAGTTFHNAVGATIQGAGDATLTTGTALTNDVGSTVAVAGNLTVRGTSAFSLNNSGRLQAGGDIALGESARAVNLTNAASATVRSGGDARAYLGSFTNHGNIQIGDSGELTLNTGVNLINEASGKVISGDALTIDTANGNFAITNSGLIQAGGKLQVGAIGRTATLTQTSTSAKLFADTFEIHAGAITNRGMIMGLEGGTLNAMSLYNEGSGSRFIATTGTGATVVNVTGTVTNEGAIHASGDLTLNASTIDNASTGGISSLEALTLNASNDLINRSNGALYSGGTMTLTAGDDITNHEDATIDTDGDFAATAANAGSVFLNQGQINIGGNATISARTFENVMAGAENLVREWRGLDSSGGTITQHNYTTANDVSPNVSTTQWYYTGHGGYSGDWFDDRESPVYGYFYRQEAFVGIEDAVSTFGNKVKPQIAAANLTVDGFDTGRNVGGLITATGTLALNGRTSGSSFTIDAMVLGIERWDYQATWWYEYSVGDYDWWNPTGGNYITNRLTTIQSANDYFSTGAGLRAGHLSVTNVGAVSLLGSANSVATNQTSAAGGSMEGLGGAAAMTDVSTTSGSSSGSFGSATKANASGFGASFARASAGPVEAVEANLAGGVSLDGTKASGTKGMTAKAQFGATNPFEGTSGASLGNALKNATVALNGLSLKLPSNPNGLFVSNADPKAKFLVGTNVTFGIDPDSAIGSDELFKQLGVDPDVVQKRLGDPAYETYLVRQQLVDQLGTKFLTGQKNEAAQMQALMANAASEASRLGLQIGQAPTPAQLAALGQDMIWMVEQVVGGQRVLVPQVYLSAKTKSLFDPSNATLAGDAVEMDIGSLTNNGGSIAGSDSLKIKAKGDITNLSGSISGGDVSLDAGGSIINETLTRGNADSAIASKTASITSTGTLDLSAGKDVKILGGDVKAGGDASLSAGGEIVVDTIQTKTTTRETTGSSGFIGSSSSTTTTTEVKNQASDLDFGGNLKIKSGGDTTLAGSNLNVQGNLDTDIQGDLNILARQDQKTVQTETSNSGFGVGGGLYGSQTTTTNDFTGTNVGSKINVGGNANLNTANTLTVEGSDLNIKGDASITAKDVLVLDGKDERRTTTTTTTTTIGVFTDSGTEGTASAEGKMGALGASGKAEASGSASGEATIGVRATTETRRDYESKSVGSNLNIGGNLKMNVENDVTLRGSNINAQGDVDVNAKNINLLAGQNVKTSSTDTMTATVGLYVSGTGSGEASANGNSAANYGEAGARAEAEVGAGLKTQLGMSSSSSGSSQAVTSGIGGRSVNLNAENKITEEGARLNASGNLTLSATELESRAAADKTWASSSSDTITTRTGVYADAQADGNVGGVEGTNGSASVSAGLKNQIQGNTTSSSSSSSTAVTSSYSGGNVTLNVKNKASLEGTQINSSGTVDITAGSLDYKAAQNTSSSSSSEINGNLEVKAGVGAGASAGPNGGDAGYGVTAKGKINADGSFSESSSSTAVVGGINGGTVNIKTTQGDVNLEGTKISSTGDTTVNAKGNLNYTEARNTSSSSSSSFNGEIRGEVGTVNNEIEGRGGYAQDSSNSSTAVTGGINSGGNITVKAGGNATLVGADLNAKGDTSLEAGGSVNLQQATSTSSSSGFNIEGEAKLGTDGGGVKASGGYESSSNSTADTANISSGGSVKIKSGTDTNIQGSNISAGTTVDVNVGGALNITAKQESSSSVEVAASGGIGNGGAALMGNVTGSTSDTKTGATISGGSGVNLTSGAGGTKLEGTQVSAKTGDVNVTSAGTVKQTSAVSTSVSGSIGAAIGSATAPGLTDLSVGGGVESQKTSLQSANGNVKVQSNAKPAPAASTAAPKNAAAKPPAAPRPVAQTDQE